MFRARKLAIFVGAGSLAQLSEVLPTGHSSVDFTEKQEDAFSIDDATAAAPGIRALRVDQ